MPELNQNFIKGRMNKDLDERLVPNGEYRDALNVEASTSEGSEVGTVQTLVGNTAKGTSLRGNCVGSIADERTNKIYYLISSPDTHKDAIIEYDSETETEVPVVVDVYQETVTLYAAGHGTFNHVHVPETVTNIRRGMIVTGILAGTSLGAEVYVSKVEEDSGFGIPGSTFPGYRVFLEQVVNNNVNNSFNSFTGDQLTFTAERTLNFDKDEYVTGINIIDNFLFWTDNRYEPKQIKIDSFIAGTTSINTHTRLNIQDPKQFNAQIINYNLTAPGVDNDFINESHITVIKKSPLTPPQLDMSSTKASRTLGIWAELTSHDFTETINNSVVNRSPGYTFTATTVNQVSWVPGDIILLTSDNVIGTNQVSFSKHDIRLEVNAANSTGTIFDFTLLAITSTPLTPNLHWYMLLDQERAMFEFKFPRFGYRYRYVDGEYSSFSPFSIPAFMPSTFDYLPKKGYNLGMVNNLRTLKVTDFILEEELLPKGVVAVDILYKESDSPNVYTVKTILHGDDEWNAITTGGLMKGATMIESEMIYATLPSNQLLRPWDNVPRKALGQEMSGNRIIYANYLQSYNLEDINNKEIKIDIKVGVESSAPNMREPGKSIKSIRTYQLGVVYRDIYGRETPVLAPSSIDTNTAVTVGTIDIPKGMADNYNKLTAKINNKVPKWADTYKFFVKETSNEYYNLAMDRWYDADDGNIWLSFSSSERNKITEDTFLILKKQHDNDTFVAEPSRYKVLAVENEAPQYVKRRRSSFGSIVMTFLAGGEPFQDFTQLHAEEVAFSSSSLVEAIGKQDLIFRIKNTTQTSEWYDINGINLSIQGNYYLINLDKKLEDDVIWASVNGVMNSGIELEIAQNVYTERPEFDGRFFVKIYKDVALEENILRTQDSTPTFAIKSARHHFYLNNKEGRDAEWWEEAWERTDFFIDGESRNLVGNNNLAGALNLGFMYKNFGGLGSTAPISAITGNPIYLNDGFYCGYDGPYVYDDGYGIDCNRPISSSNGNKIPNTSSSSPLGMPSTMEISVSHLEEGISGVQAEAFSLINTNQYSFWQLLKSIGTLFRWSNDPDGLVYEITGVLDSGSPGPPDPGTNGSSSGNGSGGILNYSSADNLFGIDKMSEDDNKSRRLYLTFRTSASGWIKDVNLQQPLPSGLINTDPDMYYSDVDFMSKAAWWQDSSQYANGGPPSRFRPIDNFSSASNISSAISGAPISIGHSNPVRSTSQTELGSGNNPLSTVQKNNYTNTLEVLDVFYDEDNSFQSVNPAIWETEPKENIDLDIYYEASQAYPTELSSITNELFAHVGSTVTVENPLSSLLTGTTLISWSDNTATLSNTTASLNQGDILAFTKNDGSVVRAEISSLSGTNGVVLKRNISNMRTTLSWFNCYSFGNGVESNRIRDDYNAVTIDKGPKASMTLAEQYKEERRGNGLIHSGIYNSTSGVNSLNQFVMAEPITKDLNPRYGTIQKLHSRDTDIVALCEDKILKILSEKDAVFNADGNTNLTATNKVLGQVIAYTGEYGISKNPESFAYQAYRSYFSDKARGVVLRLSKDGITPISEHGMKDFFADNLRSAKNIIGSYDDKKSTYNISLKSLETGRSTVVTTNSNTSTVTQTVINTTFTPTANQNALGNWFRYGGVVDSWAEFMETNGNSGALKETGGWTGIGASNIPTHPVGVEHGVPGLYGANPTLNNPITLWFHKDTFDYPQTPSFDSTPNWNDLIAALNTNGANNVYIYQTYYWANYTAPVQPPFPPTNPWPPSSYQHPHQSETCYSVESIAYDAATSSYKVIVNWMVGASSFQDTQVFNWSLVGPFDETTSGPSNPNNGNDNGDDPKGSKSYTISFSDKTNGWISFKSWIIDSGLSLNNKFYTFPDNAYHDNSSGYLWEHRTNGLRNNFYDTQYVSELEFLLNGSPSTVKSLASLKYSGSQSRISKNVLTGLDSNSNNQFDAEYYNNFSHSGWFADEIETDLQSGKRLEFKEKEGKWFSAMQGEQTFFNSAQDTNIDMSEFSYQGIGMVQSITENDDEPGIDCSKVNVSVGVYTTANKQIGVAPTVYAEDLPYTITVTGFNAVSYPASGNNPNSGGGGGSNNTMFNNLPDQAYTITVTSAGGCTYVVDQTVSTTAILGCTDPLAVNYNPLATQDDGSCKLPSGRLTVTVKDDPSDH